MSAIIVTGGTSGPGAPTVDRLRTAGHHVHILSRKPGEDHVVADLDTGVGLEDAVAGAEVVVHLATNRRKDLPGTKRLLTAARAAGVGHFVYISIVGVDEIPYFYYRDKLANEHAIAASGVPFTLLRSTQFHSFPGEMINMTGGHFFVDLPIQPIGVEDVADRLAELASGPPSERVADIGGPETLEGRDVVSRLQAAGRAKKPVFTIRFPGKTFNAFRTGHHLAGLPGYGTQTFDEWVASGETK